jgi:hypothetical protein
MPERPSEPNSRSASDEAATLHLFVPDCAPKSSANLNGWIELKPLDNLRRPTRARSSERAARVTFVNQRSGPTEESATKVSVRHRARA